VRALTSIIISGMGAANIPGLAVGIWVPGRGRLVKAFGFRELAPRNPPLLSLHDHFRIASITKSFTATAVLRLAERHKLALTDHLARYIRGIPRGHQVTIAELLDMTSGIYDYVNDPKLIREETANPLLRFDLHDLIRIVNRHQPLFEPGTDVAYDNSNYYLLGVIAERVTGRPLHQVIKAEILSPLGLSHTSYPATPAMPAPFSHGYLSRPNQPPRDVTASNPAFAAGAGAMISTLGDLKVWAKALATGRLLTRAGHRLQLKSRIIAQTPKVTIRYGSGITDVNGFLGHDGAIVGYGSAMFYLPSRDATIVLLGNNNDNNAPAPLAIFVAIAAYLFPRQFPHGL
jgi:D-alanyl-D-alanine carboxypeptidase